MIRIINGLKGVEVAVATKALAIVVDSLRASATLCAFFVAGAAEVMVCRETETARAIAASDKDCVLAGERDSIPPEGFALGNSPVEAAEANLLGKKVVFTSTNGAKMLAACKDAGKAIVGGVINIDAVGLHVQEHLSKGGEVVIIPAGDNGEECAEDWAAAILIAESNSPDIDPDQESVFNKWKYGIARTGLPKIFINNPHSKELVDMGFERDVLAASQLNIYPCVPQVTEYFQINGTIVARLSAQT